MGPPENRMESAETPESPAEVGRNGESSKSASLGEAGVGQTLPTSTGMDYLSKRILNSAAGLTSSASGMGSPGSLRPEDVAVGGKGSSAGPSNSAHRTAADQAPPVRHGVRSSDTFRSRHDGGDESERPFQDFMGVASQDFGHGAFTTEAIRGSTKHASIQGCTVEAQEARDGEEVAALLSDPASLQFTDDVDFGGFSAQLPPRLRACLLGDDSVTSSTWDCLLNFWPVADDSLELGSSYPGGKPAWLAQWKHVLTSYTDEVWGELTTDAMRAKEEVETAQEGQGSDTSGLESLRRLRQILAHLSGT